MEAVELATAQRDCWRNLDHCTQRANRKAVITARSRAMNITLFKWKMENPKVPMTIKMLDDVGG